MNFKKPTKYTDVPTTSSDSTKVQETLEDQRAHLKSVYAKEVKDLKEQYDAKTEELIDASGFTGRIFIKEIDGRRVVPLDEHYKAIHYMEDFIKYQSNLLQYILLTLDFGNSINPNEEIHNKLKKR